MAETRADAEKAFDAFLAAHWRSIRTTNPIESTFATVRLRTAKTRGCVTRNTILSLAFNLGQSAQKRWRRLRGYQWLDKLERGITFIDGIENTNPSDGNESSKTDRSAA